jgi:SAM-dependent methyltransferase
MVVDFEAMTARQQRMWATGDFQRIGVAQIVVGELLVRSLHVHTGERVLDVAGGAGNTALAAARRGAEAICTDYVPELLEQAQVRAAAEGLPLLTQVADAQRLPFEDNSFDVVTSTFGAMFAPDHRRTATELLRVLRPGGRLGMANWTPESWVGAQFGLNAKFLPPPAGVVPPSMWGTEAHLRTLFGDHISTLDIVSGYVEFCLRSAAAMYELFAEFFGPTATVVAALSEEDRDLFRREWIALAENGNTATDGTLDLRSEYIEVVATKAHG